MICHRGGRGVKVPLRKRYSSLECEVGEEDVVRLIGTSGEQEEVHTIVVGSGRYPIVLKDYDYVLAELDNTSGTLGTITLRD